MHIYSVTCYFSFIYFADNTLQVNTPNDPSQASMAIAFGEKKNNFGFEVRACSEVQIRLQQDINASPTYELIIGGNDNAKIKLYKQGKLVHEEVTIFHKIIPHFAEKALSMT